LTPPIYDYRLEPGDINIIIALTHAAIYDYRLEPWIDIIAPDGLRFDGLQYAPSRRGIETA
jgi:hypothetical protein